MSEFIQDITFKTDLIKIINSPDYSLIKFHADWCIPCIDVKPTYQKLAEKYSKNSKTFDENKNLTTPLNFYQIDDSKFKELSKFMNITSLPTFLCFKNGIELIRINGPDIYELKNFLKVTQNEHIIGNIYESQRKNQEKLSQMNKLMPMITNMQEYHKLAINSSSENDTTIFVNFYIHDYQDDVTEFMDSLLDYKHQNSGFKGAVFEFFGPVFELGNP